MNFAIILSNIWYAKFDTHYAVITNYHLLSMSIIADTKTVCCPTNPLQFLSNWTIGFVCFFYYYILSRDNKAVLKVILSLQIPRLSKTQNKSDTWRSPEANPN